jgi:flagellar basal-body rod protein FlgB
MILGADLTRSTLATALQGLDAQREAHQHNVSNVETPGFRATRVEFEDALRRAVGTGDPGRAGIRAHRTQDPTRVDGNNVRLDRELTGLAENGLRQQLVTEALNAQYRLLRAPLERG